MSGMPLPYDRQPGETAKAFAGFAVFRDLGPERSVLKAYRQKTGKEQAKQAPGVWNSWAAANHWHQRAAARDRDLDRLTQEAQQRARKEMGERHAKVAVAFQEKAVQRLRAMKPDEMSPADLLRYAIEAAKLERLARGEPETISEQRRTGASEEQLAIQRRTFFVELGEVLAPYPEARQAVAELLRRQIEANHAAGMANGRSNGNALPATRH